MTNKQKKEKQERQAKILRALDRAVELDALPSDPSPRSQEGGEYWDCLCTGACYGTDMCGSVVELIPLGWHPDHVVNATRRSLQRFRAVRDQLFPRRKK